MKSNRSPTVGHAIPKSPTGIRGLDEITGGGLPAGRPTLVCGNAGCGKTLLAMDFLVNGATRYGEPGVFMAFEENEDDLAANVRSLGFDLARLARRKQIVVDAVRVRREDIEESGAFDLEGLFIRLKAAIDAVGARRVVLDTVEALFGGFTNEAILRAELRRLFQWLKTAGVTAVITGERGDKALTRYGIEEYVSDCVIVLDHRVVDQTSTRRLRIVKYRGSSHGTNEYPFLIDERGISVLPVTSLGLNYRTSTARVGSGIPRLDSMLGGAGYFRGSSILVSGTAGSGKTSVAAHFARETCVRGERCLYFLFEESPDQMVRNMRSIGIELAPLVAGRQLQFLATRPTAYGLETHLAATHRAVEEFKPATVIIDPISSFSTGANDADVKAMLVRIIDYLKGRGITTLMINLTDTAGAIERTDAQISSLIDTWLLLRDVEANGERNRVMYVLKSRGMAHSNQLREFRLTRHGVELVDAYLGPAGVLTGSSRLAQEARDIEQAAAEHEELELKRAALEQKRQAMDRQIAALRTDFIVEEQAVGRAADRAERLRARRTRELEAMARSRHSDQRPTSSPPRAPANRIRR